MISQTSLDSVVEMSLIFKDVIQIMKNPKDIDAVISGIAEAKKVIEEKNKAINELEELRQLKKNKQAIIEDADVKLVELTIKAEKLKDKEDGLSQIQDDLSKMASSLQKQKEELSDRLASVINRENLIASKEAVIADKSANLDKELELAQAAKDSFLAKLQGIIALQGETNA